MFYKTHNIKGDLEKEILEEKKKKRAEWNNVVDNIEDLLDD